MNYQVGARAWTEVQKQHLPPVGVLRGWMAVERGVALASIFEAITPQAGGTRFMLCYHVLGEPKPRVERFVDFNTAQAHATKVLTGAKVIPRTLPGMGGNTQVGRR